MVLWLMNCSYTDKDQILRKVSQCTSKFLSLSSKFALISVYFSNRKFKCTQWEDKKQAMILLV